MAPASRHNRAATAIAALSRPLSKSARHEVAFLTSAPRCLLRGIGLRNGRTGAKPLFIFRTVQSNLTERGYEISCPAVNVVFLDVSAHTLYTHLFFFGLHLQRNSDGLGRLIDVVRIHQECVAQF